MKRRSDIVSQLFRVALSGVIAFAPMAPVHADLIVDPTASQEFRPSIGASSTAVPVINIVPPTAGGVSHNKFTDYDIGSTGLIHNNSLTSGTAKLGGTVGANPNFSGTAATTIVNEVTSSNSSLLAGRAEVFGNKAGLIIANPNGITCNGCGALNASRFTLTTGVPSYDAGNGNSLYFDVTGGLISIDGNGLEGLDVPEASVIARQIVLSGYISDAFRLDLVSGGLRYDYSPNLGGDVQSAITEKSLSNAGISYQIDASTLSSVSAGMINIIGNDDGVGVRLRGDITASTSDLVIDADGNLTITSNLASERDTNITTGGTASSLTNSGTIDADRDLSITTTGAVTNDGSLSASRRVTIDADGNLTNNAGKTISASQIMISDAADVTNSGTISAGLNKFLFTANGDEADLTELATDIANAINENEGFQGFFAYIPPGTTPGVIYINIEPPYHFSDMTIDVTVPTTGSDTQTFTYTSTGATTARLDITGAIEAGDQFQIRAYGDVTIGTSASKVGSLTNSGSGATITS
ncbi:MAG: filamentous hemagglutinin N-terminal domain-containing protein, partial [Alphaproteobacteria bacterium]